MPMSTGTTSQWAVRAIWHTLVRRAARFSATARVTLWSVWLTPCATTPLSAQSTSTARRESQLRTAGQGGGILQQISSRQPAQRLGQLAQWAWAAARAASSGGVMPERSFQFSFSHWSSFVLMIVAALTKRRGRAVPAQ